MVVLVLDMLNSKDKEKKRKVVIVGLGVAAETIYSILSQDSELEIIGFAVHEKFIKERTFFNKPVFPLEHLEKCCKREECQCINAVGYSNLNQNREAIFHEVLSKDFSFLSYIHPKSTVMTDKIGRGVFVMPGAILEPSSQIGDNTVLWSNVVIAHHVEIQDNCWIASGTVVAGNSKVEKNTFIGVNATIANKVVIGSHNIIGGAAFISKTTDSYSVFLSRSAEKHRFNSQNYSNFIAM